MNYLWLPPANWFTDDCTVEGVRRAIQFLTERGTFDFPTLENGLFSAAASTSEDFATTGYQHVWVRDNVQIAYAHWEIGEKAVAVRTAESLMKFYVTHHPRWQKSVTGETDPQHVMHRPHIRFDGRQMLELEETWSHAQNDALGYFVWFYCRLVSEGLIHPGPAEWAVLSDIAHFWQLVRFWEDEDSGHWEEHRKINASSIGPATAGLKEFRQLIESTKNQATLNSVVRPVSAAQLDKLIAQGTAALESILPFETAQNDPAKRREVDAALLFLIDPLDIVPRATADLILSNVIGQLLGPHGIRRYRGDSYWCANYKQLLAADQRTSDFSDDMSSRDRLLQPGQEAQWCIFDPIVSSLYGRRFQQTGERSALSQQLFHLRRSLAQMTGRNSPLPFRCPESYYLENSVYVPNDLTPLLWTQANLRRALHSLEKSAALCDAK